jgi:hypothetical protein
VKRIPLSELYKIKDILSASELGKFNIQLVLNCGANGELSSLPSQRVPELCLSKSKEFRKQLNGNGRSRFFNSPLRGHIT